MSITTMLNPDRPVLNILPWKDPSKPGLRKNITTYTKVILFAAEGYELMKLHHPHTGLSIWLGFVVAGIVLTCLYVLKHDDSASAKWTGMLFGFFLGIIATALVIYGDFNASGLFYAALVLATIVTFLCTGLTTWYPHGRETKNRGE